MRFYDTPRWKKIRESVLRRDGYICKVSSRYGRKVEATHVHHIFPRDEYPEFQWCKWNLISVCLAAHNALHDRNTDALTNEGKDLLLRTAKKLNMEYKDGRWYPPTS